MAVTTGGPSGLGLPAPFGADAVTVGMRWHACHRFAVFYLATPVPCGTGTSLPKRFSLTLICAQKCGVNDEVIYIPLSTVAKLGL